LLLRGFLKGDEGTILRMWFKSLFHNVPPIKNHTSHCSPTFAYHDFVYKLLRL